MSGHSKWSTIKRKKGKADAQRGKIFTRLIREIIVAAREGGGDPDSNPRLRTAVDSAKTNNMPQDNIKRAIQRGTGELPGTTYESHSYEGYGPGGVAVLVETLTDNKNRTTAELRHIFSRHGGNLGEAGCVAWMFESKGLILVDKEQADAEKIFEMSIEAGAEDVDLDQDAIYEITTTPTELHSVSKALQEKAITPSSSELIKQPSTQSRPGEKELEQYIRLRQALEDHDDVQAVHDNLDVDAEVLEKLL